jgi:SPP1 gp7 family putative phage head morphogenesis protein
MRTYAPAPAAYSTLRQRMWWALVQLQAAREDALAERERRRLQQRLWQAMLRPVRQFAWRRLWLAVQKQDDPVDQAAQELAAQMVVNVERIVRAGWTIAILRTLYELRPGGVTPLTAAPELAEAVAAQFGTLIKGIEETLREELADLMLETMQESKTFEEFARRIRQRWAEASRQRARLIAITEYNRAASYAKIWAYARDPHITHKQWVTVRDPRVCSTCIANEAAGPILKEDDFPSGDGHPPAHPRCRCNVVSAL